MLIFKNIFKIGKIMSQQSINSNEDLSALLVFQDNFISLVHTNLFRKQQSFQQVFLTFQIHHISQINDKFNKMVATLTSQLVDKKLGYELNLRDSFQRLLQSDFLPFLRINRYQLTKLSLYGFDIYVEPLQAVLQILSRLEVSKKRVLQSKVQLEMINSSQNALQRGWEVYMAFLDQWKISFNLYMLQEYLRVGSKSFLKKDREILFTGISNLYNSLVSTLSTKENFKLLKDLAQLNNSLYHFHQSFNYFQFYTFLLPLQNKFQPIFCYMKEIVEKCLRTNILTPLLFGILRHRESFLAFIEEINSQIWLPYLNVIISGIAINLKFRILEYEQIMQIFQKATRKAGLLGQINTDYIFGTLEDSWKDAKQFFISAVKVGFNSGEVQIWKSIQLQQIGPKVISSVINGMLLNIEQNQQIEQYLGQVEEKLQQQVRKLSGGKIDCQTIKTSIYQLQKGLQTQQQFLCLNRILNLLAIANQINQYTIHFAISNLLNINFPLKTFTQKLIQKCLKKINNFLRNRKINESTFIKDSIIALHKKFPPQQDFEQIIKLYIDNYQTKKCVAYLLEILPLSSSQCRDKLVELISQSFLINTNSKFIKIKTFQKQLIVKNCLVNPSYETHSVLNVLVHEISNSQANQRKEHVVQLIKKLTSNAPWITFCLLNFPVTKDNKICSLVSYLIENNQHHQLLKAILLSSKDAVLSQEGEDLIKMLSYPNICENLCKRINQTDESSETYSFAKLLLWILQESNQKDAICKDLLATYLYILQKNTKPEYLPNIIDDIVLLSGLAFGNKLETWLAVLFMKRIEDRFDLQRVNRKKLLKTQKNCVYFINQLQAEAASNVGSQKIKKKSIETFQTNQQSKRQVFWSIYNRLSKINQEQLLLIIQKQNIGLIQQLKNFYIPNIAQQLIAKAFETTQSMDLNQSLKLNILNTQNYLHAVNIAVSNSNLKFLAQNKLIPRLSDKISYFLALQSEKKVNFMKDMSQNLSQRERRRIAQNFYLQWSFLGQYIQNLQGIEYLVILNSSNWRMAIEYFNKEFSSFSLQSLLLQYREYLSITSQTNQQYESSIKIQATLFNKYVRLFKIKLQTVFSQSVSDEELQLKCAHEFCSLNLVIVSLQLKEITIKLSWLHKQMNQRGISYKHSWIEDIIDLNNTINKHVRGKVLMPDFSNGFCLTNQLVLVKYKVEIGVFLQKYYQIIGKNSLKSTYHPTNLQKVTFQEISQDKMTIINKSQLPTQAACEEALDFLLKQQCLSKGQKEWELNYQKIIDNQQNLSTFYKLGCLAALKQTQSKAYYLPPFLRQLLKREKLSWQLIKSIRPDKFHFIKAILVQSSMTDRQLFFVDQEQELIPEGKVIKVNDYNKIEYCEKIALKAIGSKVTNCAKSFFQGFMNQKFSI